MLPACPHRDLHAAPPHTHPCPENLIGSSSRLQPSKALFTWGRPSPQEGLLDVGTDNPRQREAAETACTGGAVEIPSGVQVHLGCCGKDRFLGLGDGSIPTQ